MTARPEGTRKLNRAPGDCIGPGGRVFSHRLASRGARGIARTHGKCLGLCHWACRFWYERRS